jgi:hypothetical protein
MEFERWANIFGIKNVLFVLLLERNGCAMATAVEEV